MKRSKIKTLGIGLVAGVAYAFLAMLLVNSTHKSVSVSYIFLVPVVIGVIPVLFSTKEQLKTYSSYIILPWISVLTFFFLAWTAGYEGMICLTIIVAPFLILGTLGAFIARLIKLKQEGKGTKLYLSLFIPFVFLATESYFITQDQFHTVQTSVIVTGNRSTIWNNIKNVKDIQPDEISTRFLHVIGVPKPLDGRLNQETIGGIRKITWEKGILFNEIITSWDEGYGFSYDIRVDPNSIPPTTLDEHVMVGGKYFDVVKGSYRIDSLNTDQFKVTLSCTYRITTNLNAYSKLWADFILNDFNEMILDVIKNRCETQSL